MRVYRRITLLGVASAAFAACAHGGASSDAPLGIEAVDLESRAGAAPRATELPPVAEHRAAGGSGVDDLGSWRDRSQERDVPAGMAMDDELSRMGYVLGSLRAARGDGPKGPPPRAVLEAWESLLEELDGYLDQPPRGTSSVQLVRIKLTLQSEIELDGGEWRMPGHLTARIRSRLAYLDHRIERAAQDVTPMRRGSAGPLFAWPLDGVVVTSDFGWRRDPFHRRSRFHVGIDLDAYIGQLISSSADGRVTWADWNGNHGKHVEIVHSSGWVTRYSHLSEILVRVGDRVKRGEPIGLAGQTGRATGPHLHFEMWLHGDVQDPIEVLGEPPLYYLSGLLSGSAGDL